MPLSTLATVSDLSIMQRRPPRRPTVSRRRLLQSGLGLSAGLAFGSRLVLPGLALAQDEAPEDDETVAPLPIEGGIVVMDQLFHLFLPGAGNDPSTIGGFNGFVGLVEIVGMGTTGEGDRLPFSVDMRFMDGQYIGVDGKRHRDSFVFI